MKYDAYGAIRNTDSSTSGSNKFCGGLGHTAEDSTGLTYMRARYYDPAIGRFISEDPAGDGVNWFVYCRNNPVNLQDQDGKKPLSPDQATELFLGGYAMVCVGNFFAVACFGCYSATGIGMSITGLALMIKAATMESSLNPGAWSLALSIAAGCGATMFLSKIDPYATVFETVIYDYEAAVTAFVVAALIA
ncbi:MAG: RHS repeat-associated core domain-containing protein [Armatimonadota bacterium]